jgi:hypothetical protein
VDWRDPAWLDDAHAWIRANVPGTPAPQAFTHLAQINAVVHLIQAELREKRGFSMAHQIVT